MKASGGIVRILALILAAGGASLGLILSAAGAGPDPRPNDPAASLRCSDSDTIATYSATIVDVPGGPESPGEAMQAFLDGWGFRAEASDMASRQASASTVEYDLEEGADTVARFFSRRIGDSWAVTGYSACSATIQRLADG